MFPAGKKDMDSAVDFDGGRTADDIVAWARDKVAENIPPPEVYEASRNIPHSLIFQNYSVGYTLWILWIQKGKVSAALFLQITFRRLVISGDEIKHTSLNIRAAEIHFFGDDS